MTRTGSKMKQILPTCNCTCHAGSTCELKRPTMSRLHRFVKNREWNEIKRAIRNDVSVAMRIDDSAEEDMWFRSAREAAWKRDVCGICVDVNTDAAASNLKDDLQVNKSDQDAKEDNEALPVRYWVPNQNMNGQSAIRQKRTLLHSISKLKFHSDEALIVQLSTGDCDELHDLVDASLTVKMLIDASVNELKPLEERCYNEDIHQIIDEDQCVDKACQNCSCYYQCMYCPPVGLDPVDKYVDSSDDTDDSEHSSDTKEKVLHKSALTMTDALGATPLHILTGEGSAHVDLVKTFLGGCLIASDRRPTVCDLLSAQNGHGCTPFHFLSESGSEEVLRVILDRLHEESIDDSFISHPLMIQDNEGELPLHFACSHGANARVLSLMTGSRMALSSAIIRNNECRLAIDELLIWYKGVHSMIGRGHLGSESDEEENESIDEYESNSSYENCESDENETTNTKSSCSPDELIRRAMDYMFVPSSTDSEERVTTDLSLSQHCKYYLWDRMLVLIQAAATFALLEEDESVQTDGFHMHPIHSAVIATKFFDFPAVSLVASVLMERDQLVELNNSNIQECTNELLLQEDSLGQLPLHLACGQISRLNKFVSAERSYLRGFRYAHKMAMIYAWPGTVRWTTSRLLPCSMIDYLLYLCPESAQIPTREGRLPLQLYLDGGYEGLYETHQSKDIWDDAKRLSAASPEAIRTTDISSHMYPFQTAAAALVKSYSGGEENSDSSFFDKRDHLTSLELSYRLILEDPSLCRKI